MSDAQRSTFIRLMKDIGYGFCHFHHGDCVGADEQAAEIVAAEGFATVHIHPPIDVTHRAHSHHGVEYAEPKTHFARNRDIVDVSEVLIATPWQTKRPAPKTGGGTWYTVEYAEKRGKRVAVIWPDGTVEGRIRPAIGDGCLSCSRTDTELVYGRCKGGCQ